MTTMATLGFALCNDDGRSGQRYAPIAANGYQFRDTAGQPIWTRDRIIAEAIVAHLNRDSGNVICQPYS